MKAESLRILNKTFVPSLPACLMMTHRSPGSECVEPLLFVADRVPSSPLDFSPISDCKRLWKLESWCHEAASSRDPSQPASLAASVCSHRASSGEIQPRSAHVALHSFGARDFATGRSAKSCNGICRREDGRFGRRSA